MSHFLFCANRRRRGREKQWPCCYTGMFSWETLWPGIHVEVRLAFEPLRSKNIFGMWWNGGANPRTNNTIKKRKETSCWCHSRGQSEVPRLYPDPLDLSLILTGDCIISAVSARSEPSWGLDICPSLRTFAAFNQNMFGPIRGSAGVGPLGFWDANAAMRSAVAETTAHALAEEDVFTIPLTGPDLIHPLPTSRWNRFTQSKTRLLTQCDLFVFQPSYPH